MSWEKICCHKFELVLVKSYFSRNKGPNSAEKIPKYSTCNSEIFSYYFRLLGSRH